MRILLSFCITFTVSVYAAQDGSEGPVTLDRFGLLDVSSTPEAPSFIRYMGQSARNGIIDLTPTNGFFDRCFEATGQQAPIEGDSALIRSSFDYLSSMKNDRTGSARWHLWCPEPGDLVASFFMDVPHGEADHPWKVRVAEQEHFLEVEASDGNNAQPHALTFSVRKPGRVSLVIDCTELSPPPGTRFRFIRLTGTAIDRSSLLRVRWRPSAVHARFFAPAECPQPNMWVFETRALTDASSYSPLTTPFGYYGTSFVNRLAKGGFNFSMWVAGRNATEAPPIWSTSRLIGTGYPEAIYSSFGHEGTGVKFRGGTAYPEPAGRTIQALRVEMTDGVMTHFAYVYDESQECWRLYASGQQVSKAAKRDPEKRKGMDGIIIDQTGSFCEIPGPPNRQRSGDVVREIVRRGWFYGRDGKWYRARLRQPEKGMSRKTRRDLKLLEEGQLMLKSGRVYYMDNYATEGWMGMRTGGMECVYPGMGSTGEMPVLPQGGDVFVPEYLSAAKTRQLFQLPVEFGESVAEEIGPESAVIDYEIERSGSNSRAVLWYGTYDALTFTTREMKRGSAVQKQLYSPERTWQHATPERRIDARNVRFRLEDLEPATKYYYRLFVSHDEGKSWDYRSHTFETDLKEGEHGVH